MNWQEEPLPHEGGEDPYAHDALGPRWPFATWAPWWTYAPGVVSVVVAGTLIAAVAVFVRDGALRTAVVGASAPPLTLGFGLIAAAAAAGFLGSGIGLSLVLRDRHRWLREHEGLVEEISQEFDKVRDEQSRAASHAADALSHLERSVRKLEERLGVAESRLVQADDEESVRLTVLPPPTEAAARRPTEPRKTGQRR